MDTALVQDLADLAPRLSREATESGLKEATDILTKLGERMNATPTLCVRLGQTPLSTLLRRLLTARPSMEADGSAFLQFNLMIAQNALVAIALLKQAANNERLFKANYPQTVMEILINAATNLPTQMWKDQMVPTFSNLIGVLTEVALRKHEPTIKALATQRNFSGICKLAATAYTCGDWSEDIAPATLARYLWVIALPLAKSGEAEVRLTREDAAHVASVLRFWVPPNPPAPAARSSLSPMAVSHAFGRELGLVTSAAAILGAFQHPARLDPAMLSDEELLATLFDYVDNGGVPAWVDRSQWDQTTATATTQALVMTRSSVSRLLSLLVGVAEVPVWYWQRVSAWLQNDERLDSALAAFGNGISNDDAARMMLQPPSDLGAALLNILKPGTSKNVQHACVGLLRNLSIPEGNVALLGQPVLDALLSIEPFDSSFDAPPMESLQRNALHVIRGLARDPALAARYMANDEAVLATLMLCARTPKAGLKALVNDTVATVIAQLGPGGSANHARAWTNAVTDGPITLMVMSLVHGADEATLLSSGVAGLRAVLEYRPAEARGEVLTALRRDGNKGTTALANIVAPPASAPPKASAEVQAVALAIVRLLGDNEVLATVREAVRRNVSEGRAVAPGAAEI